MGSFTTGARSRVVKCSFEYSANQKKLSNYFKMVNNIFFCLASLLTFRNDVDANSSIYHFFKVFYILKFDEIFSQENICLSQFRWKLLSFIQLLYYSYDMLFWLLARISLRKFFVTHFFCVKGAQAWDFGSEFLTPSKPIWVGNIGSGRKKIFCNRCAFGVFSAKIVFSTCSATAWSV